MKIISFLLLEHVLKLIPKKLGVSLDQDALALANQPLPGPGVEIELYSVLFFLESSLCLPHVVADRVGCDKGIALGSVVDFGSREEGSLELVAIEVEVGLRRVGIVETERDWVRDSEEVKQSAQGMLRS